MNCPECGGSVIFNGREYVCEECGCVVGYPLDYRIDTRAEGFRKWRHHGSTLKLYHPDFGISTELDVDGLIFNSRHRRLNEHNSQFKAFLRDLLATVDGYPKHVQQQALYLARKVYNDKLHYKKRRCLLKALLFVACKLTYYPLTAKDLCDDECDRRFILKYAKQIMARYRLKYDPIRLGLAFLRKCCTELSIDFDRAYEIFVRVSQLCTRHKPNAVAGAVAYYVSGACKSRIAEIIGVCTTTISEIASEIVEVINSN